MVVAYGLQFGNDVTYQWMVALISSFFCSILLTQPIKVLFIIEGQEAGSYCYQNMFFRLQLLLW